MRDSDFGGGPRTDHIASGAGTAMSRPRGQGRAAATLDQLLQEATKQQRSGRLAEAARCFELVLRHQPDHADALLCLGAIHAQLGRLHAAALLLNKGLSRAPFVAEGHNNLGMVLHGLKRTDAAIAAYKTAIAIRPRYAMALNNLGIAFAAIARTDEAIAQYQEALEIQPDYVEALNNFGAALHATGRAEDAIKRFRTALALRPDFVEAQINLGHALVSLERTAEAIRCYRAALRMQPDNALVHLNVADALHKAARCHEAGWHYERACILQPDLAPAHAGWGTVCLELGRIEEARQSFETAISIDPRRPSYFLSLARTVKLDPLAPQFKAMLALADDIASLDDGDKADIHFALGTALSDAGRNHEAFEHLLAGNALKRRTVSFDETSVLRRMDRTRTMFTADLMRDRGGRGNSSCLPIFIVGMPRSGSTLVEQILASHPSIFGAGELESFNDALHAVGLDTPTRPFPDSVPHWTDRQLCGLANDYLRRLTGQVSEEKTRQQITRVTDKMLANFRYVGLIHLALPNARIIHTRRDPIDTCLSCFSIQFAKLPFTFDLGELGRYYRAYLDLMQRWRMVLPPGRMLEVQYEDLVENFDYEARRIVAHCGLPWDDSCARFYESTRPVRTASVAQVRRPIYRGAVGRWRPDPETLHPLLEALDPGDETL